ncbi:MAG: hypothetical protein AB7I79_04355 [Rhizobiaceae bacterium]
MARYFFDMFDGGSTAIDEIGIDCEGPWQVRARAIEALPEIARQELPDGDQRLFEIKVRDETGSAVFECSLRFTATWL